MGAESREFSLGAILTITTERLLAPGGIGDVYAILNFMSGDSLMTHQLPRVSKEVAPAILRQHPDLAEIAIDDDPADKWSAADWTAWLDTMIARYGASRHLTPLAAGEHERIDPISEMAETIHPDKITIIKGDGHGR
ncbi:MAG: hypothetical protein ACK4NA_12635 [Alphaproteobacteria bacterium]